MELLRQPSDNLTPLFFLKNHHFGIQQQPSSQQQQQQPCLASQHNGSSRCQSRQKNTLTRQASAGSLPPEHQHQHHHHHHMHMHPMHAHHDGVSHGGHHGSGGHHAYHSSFEDAGYKSDGEAYHANACYKSGSRSRHNAGGCQRPMRSLSGHIMHPQEPIFSRSLPRNGYLSDGEGYVIQNQRVSRSGKYGSQASSPRSDHHRAEAMNDEESEESEEDDEEEEEEEGLEEEQDCDIEQEIHLNDMVAAKAEQEMNKAVTNKAPNSASAAAAAHHAAAAQADLIVSYSAFQAEAAAALSGSGEYRLATSSKRLKNTGQPISCVGHYVPGGSLTGAQEQLIAMATVTTTVAETVRRSSSNGCVVDGPVMSRSASEGNSTGAGSASGDGRGGGGSAGGGQRNSRRSSRSNSRQGDFEAPGGGGGPNAGGVPSGVMGSRPPNLGGISRGGGASSSQSDHRSDGGYRSDGWYQSMHPRCQPPTAKRPDGYRSEGSTESPKHAEQGGGSEMMPHQQNNSVRPRSSSSKHSGSNNRMPGSSGGISSAASAGALVHPGAPPGSMMHPSPRGSMQHGLPPPMHHFPPRASQSFQSFQRQESTGSFYSSHSAPTNCGNKHHHHHHHQHQHHHHGPPGRHPPQNLESCSTQSSSSSASGPPDYATCSAGGGGGPPPSYDQASVKRGHHKNPPAPPPRGDSDPMAMAPKIPPHQGGNSSRRKGPRDQSIGSHSRSNSGIRLQQGQGPPHMPQQGHHQPHRHHNSALSSSNSKTRHAGTNELYYMGEFYG